MECLWWNFGGWNPHCLLCFSESIGPLFCIGTHWTTASVWSSTSENETKNSSQLDSVDTAFPKHTLVRHLWHAKCCSKPRGHRDRRHSVCYNGFHDLIGQGNQPPVTIGRDEGCAEGSIKWQDKTEAGGNNSAFREVKGDSGKISQTWARAQEGSAHCSRISPAYFYKLGKSFHCSVLQILYQPAKRIHGKSCV